MVMPRHRLSVIAAVAATIAVGWGAPALAQSSAAPAPAAPQAAPVAPQAAPAAPQAAPAAPQAAMPQAAAPNKVAHTRKSVWHHKKVARVQTVERVQKALNSDGAGLKVDGNCGPKTKAALRVFQKQHKLKVTGLPNQATLKALGIHKS